MTAHRLVAPSDAAKDIARLFSSGGNFVLEVAEDRCFGHGNFWRLGRVRLAGEQSDPQDLYRSVDRGYYDFEVADGEVAQKSLESLLGITPPASNADKRTKESFDKSTSRIPRILDAVATAAIRVGLCHPVLDAASVESMPFKGSTTVIADTSAILQGGLDFVVRFLYPAARVKIPAIANMEIVNLADGFFKRRRGDRPNKTALLFDHLLSQAGQRVLLRLELRAETEIERTALVGDPLRNAFQRDSDPEWTDLNLSVPLRSYCDRLIIEAARQHQVYANPGHAIQVLTSDQGFARMALAEGLTPLYFSSIRSDDFFGRRFTGAPFNPLSGSLYRVPFATVLWEFATAFGLARIASADGTKWVEAAAIGEGLAWSPVHSRDDLLWVRTSGLPTVDIGDLDERRDAPTTELGEQFAARSDESSSGAIAGKKTAPKRSRPASSPRASAEVVGFYRLSVERLFELLSALGQKERLSEGEAWRLAGVDHAIGFNEFRRLILSGNFASLEGTEWTASEAGIRVGAAIRAGDVDAISTELRAVPSIDALLRVLETARLGSPVDLQIPQRAEPTYRTLAEVLSAGAGIPGEGFYPTPSNPPVEEFAETALVRFGTLDIGDGLVSVGAWLEALIRGDGIHPERARRSLDEAAAAGIIVRSTEGSTTDTRHDKHVVRVLRTEGGSPKIQTIHLYRGDFLLPNKSSSSLKLARPHK